MAEDLCVSACTSCHRRKVKCDRLPYSCSACLKIDIPCRYPSKSSPSLSIAANGIIVNHGFTRRKPRGPYKKGKTPREKELEDRIQSMARRYEELERLNQDNIAPVDASEALSVSPPLAFHDRIMRHNSITSGSFGFTLGEGEAQYQLTPSSHSGESLLSSLQLGVQRHLADSLGTEPFQESRSKGNLAHPPCNQIFELWHIFIVRVDPVTKLVHCPSFSEQFSQAMRRTDTTRVKASMHMLMFSIYFASINALSEDETIDRFNERQDVLLARYHCGMQRTQAYLDALRRPCLATLQALVLHAVCLRRHDDEDRDSFSKTFSLAIRVAQLIGLGKEDGNTAYSPLEVELRRRCWWTLSQMRLHQISDPGSNVDDTELTSDVSLPLNVNDIDLSPTADDMPKARAVITDMSYFLLTLELMRLGARAQTLSGSSSTSLEVDTPNLSEYKELERCVRRLENDILRHCHASRPFDWFMLLTGKAMLSPIEIKAIGHPELGEMHEFGATASQLYGSNDEDDMKFSLRLDIVECWYMLKTNETLKPWSWFWRNFQPAITVADICAELTKRPISSHSDRARALIELISVG